MTKKHREIDIVPFIPARDRVCQVADALLVFSVAFAGVLAGFIAIINRIGGFR